MKDLHPQDWPGEIFGNKALDLGKSKQECWAALLEENAAACTSVAELIPDTPLDFLLEAAPRLYPNQRAITLLV